MGRFKSTDEALQAFLAELKNVTPDSNGWNACCPAHDDNRNSLHVAKGDDDRLLIHCKAGCSTPEICYATGFAVADLFPPPEQKSLAENWVASSKNTTTWTKLVNSGFRSSASNPKIFSSVGLMGVAAGCGA